MNCVAKTRTTIRTRKATVKHHGKRQSRPTAALTSPSQAVKANTGRVDAIRHPLPSLPPLPPPVRSHAVVILHPPQVAARVAAHPAQAASIARPDEHTDLVSAIRIAHRALRSEAAGKATKNLSGLKSRHLTSICRNSHSIHSTAFCDVCPQLAVRN